MRRPVDGEAAVFTAAGAVGVVHALDDAVLHRGPGVGAGTFVVAALVAVLGCQSAPAIYERRVVGFLGAALRPGHPPAAPR